jgi:plastocyanin
LPFARCADAKRKLLRRLRSHLPEKEEAMQTRVLPCRLSSMVMVCLVPACGGGGAAFMGTDVEPTFRRLDLSPPTAEVTVGGTVQLTAVPLDGDGAALSGLPSPAFTSSDPATAQVDGAGRVSGLRAGLAVIRAELTAQGVTQSASSAIVVTASDDGGIGVTQPIPTRAEIATPDRTYSPGAVTIAAGGTVTWQIIERRHNVTFRAAAPPGGNIPDTREGNSVSRTFPEPGEYEYECTRHRDRGMRGRIVVVATESQRFSSLSLTPATASVALGATIQLAARPLDQNGQPMTGLPAPGFSSSDPGLATVDEDGRVRGVAEGNVAITASLTHEGTTREATASVSVRSGGGPPSTATVSTPGVTFNPSTVTISAGGTVTWQFIGTRHNVYFRSASPPGGNIPDTDEGSSASRTFPTPGTYDYVCTRHAGMTGRVVVQ